MGPILMLSWLARLKFGVKMAMLTPFGGLRGTKFALNDALEAPKWAPKGSKRAMITIDGPSTGVMSDPRGPPKGILAS